jgi:hypothetical protein
VSCTYGRTGPAHWRWPRSGPYLISSLARSIFIRCLLVFVHVWGPAASAAAEAGGRSAGTWKRGNGDPVHHPASSIGPPPAASRPFARPRASSEPAERAAGGSGPPSEACQGAAALDECRRTRAPRLHSTAARPAARACSAAFPPHARDVICISAPRQSASAWPLLALAGGSGRSCRAPPARMELRRAAAPERQHLRQHLSAAVVRQRGVGRPEGCSGPTRQAAPRLGREALLMSVSPDRPRTAASHHHAPPR